ncbi:MAG: helix-turn-helix transcriptional regulator [Pseudonocardia sp.]|nr:helix-turn-helix transcriptional regulator [Pseudonocardia sp.]
MSEPTGPGPTVRRRQLGLELRRLREARGITRDEAAEYVGVQPPTLSRIELGRQGIRVANIRLLLMLYRVESPEADALLRLAGEARQRGWWASYGDTMPDWFRSFVGLEADAAEIWTYQSELVPGLLQTTDYVRAVMRAAHPSISEAELERQVELRRARQNRLRNSNPPSYRVLMNEAVLHRMVGGPAVMAAQLAHLEEMAALPHVSLRVISFAVGAHASMVGAFVMLTFPDEPRSNCVYVDNDRGALYLERPADLDHYTAAFERSAAVALDERASRTLLAATLRAQARAR